MHLDWSNSFSRGCGDVDLRWILAMYGPDLWGCCE
jgi:hypothetical protein